MLVFGAIAGMVLLVASGAAKAVIWNPSWKVGFLEPRVDDRAVLREHAARFPNSRLRLWFYISYAIPQILILTVFLLALWNSGRNHPRP